MDTLNFLLVEDQLVAIERIKSQLQQFGYNQIETCTNSDDAMAICKNKKIDIGIIDINLEGSRLDGIELTRELNKEYKFPIIYLTGQSDVRTLNEVANTNFTEYIVKPFTPQQLFASISLVLLKHPDFQSNKKEESIFYRNNEMWILVARHYVKLNLNEVLYLQSSDGIINIYTSKKKFSLTASLVSFERQTIDNAIVRNHKSYMVNLKHIIAFDLKDHQVAVQIGKNNKWIPVGKNYRPEFYKRFPKLKSD